MEKIYPLGRQISLAVSFILFFQFPVVAQTAVVTHISGAVWLKNTPVKLRTHVGPHDTLKGIGTAEVGLLDSQRGRVLIQFKNGRRIAAKPGKHTSELYELVIGEAMKDYNTVIQATHKGVFDLNDFFSDPEGSGKTIHKLVVTGQGLPLESQQVSIGATDRFYLCPVSDTTTAIPIRRTKDSLYIPQMSKAGPYLLQVRYIYKGHERHRFFAAHVSFNWLSGREIAELSKAFTDQRLAYYHGDQDRMLDDIHQEVFDWYGECYLDGVDRYIAVSR